MFLIIGRTFREALKNFWRNGWLSAASVSVLALSLFVLGILFVVSKAGEFAIKKTQDKVNVSVYLKSDVEKERAMEIKSEIEKNEKVSSVEYISREEALEIFKKNNANNPVIVQSLEEIGENPLLSSLVLIAKDPGLYDALAEDISNSSFKEDISRMNYSRVKESIEKLNGNMADLKKVWMLLSGIFVAISVLIVFNTIRITIYTHRQEIEVMRLVGASNTFIRLPFIFEGLIYGLIASVLSMGLLFAFVKTVTLRSALSVTPGSYSIIYSQNLLDLYFSNLAFLFLIQIFFAAVIGIFSSLVAMRKYLKI